jgi:hypothetical protein
METDMSEPITVETYRDVPIRLIGGKFSASYRGKVFSRPTLAAIRKLLDEQHQGVVALLVSRWQPIRGAFARVVVIGVRKERGRFARYKLESGKTVDSEELVRFRPDILAKLEALQTEYRRIEREFDAVLRDNRLSPETFSDLQDTSDNVAGLAELLQVDL